MVVISLALDVSIESVERFELVNVCNNGNVHSTNYLNSHNKCSMHAWCAHVCLFMNMKCFKGNLWKCTKHFENFNLSIFN